MADSKSSGAGMRESLPPLRVMALHALGYCERLFYLEEVEEIRVADARVYAGRTMHEAALPDDGEAWTSATLESPAWGLKGKLDYVRYRDGRLVPFEHKRGRSRDHEAWNSDRLQIIAYAALLMDQLGCEIAEGRIRYHANNTTVRVPIDEPALDYLRNAIARARELTESVQRPPVAANESLCARCSLAPVCLPEEERLVAALAQEDDVETLRLFPENDERQIVHVTESGSRVGKQGEEIVITPREGVPVRLPGQKIAAIVLHGATQISSQTVHYAIARNIGVHWVSAGGYYAGGIAPPGGVQRRHRQYIGLSDQTLCLDLARRLTQAKVTNQLRFVLRGARARAVRSGVDHAVKGMRAELRGLERAVDSDALRGHEGMAGRYYFAALQHLLDPNEQHMQFIGRNRNPPTDCFNAALSFGYALLYREVVAALIAVGLEPAFGFFHRPRSAAYPLALDLMELFRTTMWDMPLVASINRHQWDANHFVATDPKVWLSETGRKLAISLYETRKHEVWRHPVVKYSLSYQRAIELEARLLEKEWSGAPGLFARMRMRG